MKMGFYGQDEWSAGQAETFPTIYIKRKNRWKFIVPSVSASGLSSLPPAKIGRISMSFKEMQAEHLNETMYYPAKPDWKPIQLTLYDLYKDTENPVFTWLRRAYNPNKDNCSQWKPVVDAGFICAEALLTQYDGCGNEIETWVLEQAWPQSMEFMEGDMTSSDYVACDVTFRYARAYILNSTPATLNFPTMLSYTSCNVTTTPVSMTALPESLSFNELAAFNMSSISPLAFAVAPNSTPVAEFCVQRRR